MLFFFCWSSLVFPIIFAGQENAHTRSRTFRISKRRKAWACFIKWRWVEQTPWRTRAYASALMRRARRSPIVRTCPLRLWRTRNRKYKRARAVPCWECSVYVCNHATECGLVTYTYVCLSVYDQVQMQARVTRASVMIAWSYVLCDVFSMCIRSIVDGALFLSMPANYVMYSN